MKSHGSGQCERASFRTCSDEVVIEPGVLFFHPENISLCGQIYIGHHAIIKGYYKNEIIIHTGTWIGQQVFMHGAGGIHIGKNVGIGPKVAVITSFHQESGRSKPIMGGPVKLAPVHIGDDSDIGVGSIIMPGVVIGKGVQVGAGAVVTRDVPDYAVVAGVPAKVLRYRPE